MNLTMSCIKHCSRCPRLRRESASGLAEAFAVLFFLLLLFPLSQALAGSASTQPSQAVRYEHEIRKNPSLHLHVVTVDLTDPAVHLKVSRGGDDPAITKPWETTLNTVSAMARRDGLCVAVNGNYFTPKDFRWIFGQKVPYFGGNWAHVCGWAMDDGALFSSTPANANWPSFVVSKSGKVAIGRFDRIPDGAGEIVTGMWEIVTDGKNSAPTPRRDPANAKLAPRTAIGFDRDRKTLIMLVIDGRRPDYSAGVSIQQLGDEMVRLGCWQAINLDGGGSSTMVMNDADGKPRVMNLPSDGHTLPIPLSIERNVANAFGVIMSPGLPATQPSDSN